MKLSVKISSLVILVSTIPAILVLGYTLWTIKQDNLNTTLQDVLHRVELSAGRLSNELESTQREVEAYVQMDKIKGMQAQQFLPFLTQEVIRHNGRYEKFIVATPEGHFYNTAGGNPDQNMLRTFNDRDPQAAPKNIRKRDYWQHTVGNNLQQTPLSIVSNPMISYTTGARQIVVASSIVENGKLKGLLGAAIDWDRILTLIKSIQDHQFMGYSWSPKMFLITQDGTYWYHWDPRLIASLATDTNDKLLLDENGQSITETHSLATENNLTAEEIHHITTEEIDFHTYIDEQSGKNIYLFHAPIGSNGYTLGLTVSEQELTAPLISYASILILFLLSLLAVLVTAHFWHKHNISAPLNSLMSYIHRLRDDQYNQPAPQLSNDEFGQVASTLEKMSTAITERQQALRESEVRFECAMAGTNDGLWDWDLQTQKIYFSPRWSEMLGYQEEDLAPNLSTFTKLIHPEDREACEEYINKFMHADSKHYHLRLRMLHKNGSTIYILSRAFLVRDENSGRPIRLIGTHVDITDDKLYEEKINKLNEELEQRVKQRTQELEEANKKLEATTLLDGLTQVANRRAMENDLINAYTAYQRHQRHYSVMLIDIDYFKAYNDHYGHPKGDEALRAIAKLLAGSIRNIDTVYRYGGEEFLILMPDTELDMAMNIAERTRASVCLGVECHHQSPIGYLTVSIGVATNSKTDRNWQAAIKRADDHLYQAKRNGRNQVVSDKPQTKPAAFSGEKHDKDKDQLH